MITPWFLNYLLESNKHDLYVTKYWELIEPAGYKTSYDLIITILITLVSFPPLLVLSIYFLIEIIALFGYV